MRNTTTATFARFPAAIVRFTMVPIGDGSMNVGDVKNRIAVHFQYQGPQDVRPADWTQEENLQFEVPAGAPPGSAPVPAVGDTVSLTLTEPGRRCDYRVLSRRISYAETALGLFVDIHIVVTDAVAQAPLAAAANKESAVTIRSVPKLAVAAIILGAISASATVGYVREHRHARELAASNEALSASERKLQTDLQSASDRLNAALVEQIPATPIPVEKAAVEPKKPAVSRSSAAHRRRTTRYAGARNATPPHRYPQSLNAAGRQRTKAARPAS